MDIKRTAQVSPILSSQRIANEHLAATLKLVNDQTKANGEAAVKLIQSVPQATGNVGNLLNVSV
ncbi:hypothetical protein A9Q79_06545 [Methylophaga sp. 42_25_T18]|nr:hypothetical protein A9Q79_06545 [Methylophaga sp. 42_25_T18]OUR89111.1 hypothetical protein A9Q92_01550 [Methylophaga sp. 42_8_T64]